MERLGDISMEQLWELLEEVDQSTPTRRVLAAIASKQGDSTRRLSERHNVSQQTIRNWLSRFENQPLDDAPFDENRSGRPPKLTDQERERLIADLRNSPEALGFERQTWHPELVYRHIKTEYEVKYSFRHIRRIMREAGLSRETDRVQKGQPLSDT